MYYYAITHGLAGCYMPDYGFATAIATRGELADLIRHELELAEFPARLFREVRIRKLWAFLKRHGSSCAHFHIEHKGRSVAFHGLTAEEYATQIED